MRSAFTSVRATLSLQFGQFGRAPPSLRSALSCARRAGRGTEQALLMKTQRRAGCAGSFRAARAMPNSS
jgi:hypothetical protein